LRNTFGSDVLVLSPNADGRIALHRAVQGTVLDEKERSVAQWAFDQGQMAGLGTATLPAAQWLYLPLRSSERTLGVVAVQPPDPRRFQDPVRRQLLETFAGQLAASVDRVRLASASERARLETEAERLRTSLLTSLSHDLRSPLAGIEAAASKLLEDGTPPSTGQPRREMAQTIVDEARRMNRLVANLLDMVRLETGALQVQKEWQQLEEVVGLTLFRLNERLAGREVITALPPDLPLVPMDGLLIEQVLVNLLENAIDYAPRGTPVEISARASPQGITVDVADRGPGLPSGEESRVFEKFYRTRDQEAGRGAGLGLSICRGIVEAHGGLIWAENRPGGGAVFRFTLPLAGIPRRSEPRDEAAVTPASLT
jgi:two-component system sensor histidine kinase KdpD